MIGAVGCLEDRQGTFDARAGGLQFPQLPLDGAQVDQVYGNSRVIRAVGCLVDGQGTFDARAGVP